MGSGDYFVRLKFAATRGIGTQKNCFNMCLNNLDTVLKRPYTEGHVAYDDRDFRLGGILR